MDPVDSVGDMGHRCAKPKLAYFKIGLKGSIQPNSKGAVHPNRCYLLFSFLAKKLEFAFFVFFFFPFVFFFFPSSSSFFFARTNTRTPNHQLQPRIKNLNYSYERKASHHLSYR